MSAMRNGVRPAVAGGVLAALFVASIGVSAATAIATSPDEAPAAASTPAPTPTPSPSTTSGSPSPTTSSSSTSSSSSERQVTPVTTAPTKATKAQVKQSRSALCNAKPQDLPKLDFQASSRQWIKALEVLAADRGFAPGAIDGIYNIQTRNAIRSFEGALGVAVDGVMDSTAWQALWDDLCAPDPVYVPTEPVYTPPSDNSGGGGGGGDDDGGLSRLE